MKLRTLNRYTQLSFSESLTLNLVRTYLNYRVVVY